MGDALGAAVEFMTHGQIKQRYGRHGITAFDAAYGRTGAITDDTQMTLFTADGLLRAEVSGHDGGAVSPVVTTSQAYLRWLYTQGDATAESLPLGEPGWLMSHADLRHARAPGMTCLSALVAMPSLGEPAVNDSKGCGGVMRVAPVGLYRWHECDQPDVEARTFDLAAQLAGLTHGHPTGQLSSGALAVMVLCLIEGATLAEALDAAKRCLNVREHAEETLNALARAESLASRSRWARRNAIKELGEGWIAEEALAIGVYCALVASDFREAVTLAVNHDGDSDSTGSIAGNLIGVMLGVEAIPDNWLHTLELADVIREIADDLFEYPDWRGASVEKRARIDDKYPS